jgi:hypothetical protein
MLDFSQTIDDNALRERLPVIRSPLPPGLTATAKMIARLSRGRSGHRPHPWAARFTQAPIATTDQLKRLVPETQLVRCPGAGHIECLNLDPQAYESTMISFLDDATS